MKVVCELSGGFDSAAAAISSCGQYEEVYGYFIDYGQVYAEREREAARYMSNFLTARCPDKWKGLREVQVDLSQQLSGQDASNPYIPIRNLVLGTMSANYAQSIGARVIITGSKTVEYREDDPFCWWDCTSEFYAELGALVNLATEEGSEVTYRQILVRSDKIPLTKVEVLEVLRGEDVDLRKLWNCYAGGVEPCRDCFHCTDMREQVASMGLADEFAGWW